MDKFNLKPFVFVIGAQKAGTTTIHKLFLSDANISLPKIKETHFFSKSDNYSKGLSWYISNFDTTKKIMCEVDPSYLFIKESPHRINELITHPRFIVILRKPIERALSHYYMSYYRGYETLSFVDALDMEKNRLSNDSDLFSFINHSYLKRGEYVEQIENYYKFYNRKDFLFINFEEFVSNKNSIKSICSFMGIDDRLSEIELPYSNYRKKVKSEVIRDLLYKDSFFKKAAKLVVPSDDLINRFKNLVNYINSRSYQKSELKDDINSKLESLPDKYIMWNNNQTKLLEEHLGISLKGWYIL